MRDTSKYLGTLHRYWIRCAVPKTNETWVDNVHVKEKSPSGWGSTGGRGIGGGGGGASHAGEVLDLATQQQGVGVHTTTQLLTIRHNLDARTFRLEARQSPRAACLPHGCAPLGTNAGLSTP